MFKVGAHVSISGGIPNAVDREVEFGGNCGQIFVGSPRGWKVSEIDKKEAEEFKENSDDKELSPWIVHGTYLVNFATPKHDLGERSINTVQEELNAASTLDIPFYVFHPGAHTGSGEKRGIEKVGDRLSELDIPDNVTLLLENTSGKGTTVGKKFEELESMVEKSSYGYQDIGFCLDTCHLYSAGYNFTTKEKIDNLVQKIDDILGIDNVYYLHLNDSKHPLGSEKDEHEHIGEGKIGEKGFKLFINHGKLRNKPMVLETPEDDKGFQWNIEKIKTLRT